MGKKVCENVDSKRELLYSISTIVTAPVLYYFTVTHPFSAEKADDVAPPIDTGEMGDDFRDSSTILEQQEPSFLDNNTIIESNAVISFIVHKRRIPYETVLYVILFEILKLVLVFTVFPGSHLFDQTPPLAPLWGLSSASNSGIIPTWKSQQPRLPANKKDKDYVGPNSHSFETKILEIWKGICNYIIGCVICHIFVVLLGAPIIDDCKLTFQFSVILSTWLLSPTCLAVQPSRLLQELMFISLWTSGNEILCRTRWRFAITVTGAWVGAIVVPLDWDRPWQRWPIPSLTSTIVTFFMFNLVVTLHLMCTIFGAYHKLYLLTSESNKIKNF